MARRRRTPGSAAEDADVEMRLGRLEDQRDTAAPLPLVDPTLNVTAQLKEAIRRQDDLRQSEAIHVREIMAMRENYQQQLREAESKRIDAIRAVDVAAVSRAAEVSVEQANTLATQVATSAETLRGQVSAAASAQASALATALAPITKSIEDLRQAQYQQQGERYQRTEGTGQYRWLIGTGIAAGGCVVAMVGGVLGLISLVLTVAYLHHLGVF